MTPLRSLVGSWIQKTAGILLMHQNDYEPRKLILKEAHETKVEEIKIVPYFPNCIKFSSYQNLFEFNCIFILQLTVHL